MSTQVTCPRCSHVISSQMRHCENCGVDLALAAALVGHTLKFPTATPKVPEALVPRLGDYLIERNLLDPGELQRALDYQQQQNRAGRPCLIGQALLELDLIDRTTLDEVVTEQILQLQTALQRSNQELEQRVQERTIDLQRALSQLTELNQLKTNFIANVSHELRTPLTHIKGYIDMLAEGIMGPLTTAQQEALQVIVRAETRLERLIDDLIQFSMAARDELAIEIAPFQIADLLRATCIQADPKARVKRISLQLDVPPHLPRVWADEEKIAWVLAQLLDNAIKFTAEGGQVILTASQAKNGISVSLTDNGIGIPEDRLEEIFEPFHQLDGSATRRYGGTGIGLAMVRRILDAHRLTIKVQSVLSKGSRFEFVLPTDPSNHVQIKQ